MKLPKYTLILSAIILVASLAGADEPQFQWARRMARTANTDDELAMGLAMDSQANCYVTAWFDGGNDFGGTTLTSYGGDDMYISKHNSNGALQWVRHGGSPDAGWECGRGVGVDAAGNVYVTGGFVGTASFDGLAATAVSSRGDFFIAKYNSAGSIQWVHPVGDSLYDGGSYGTGIKVDAAGNCLVVGYYDGALTLGGRTMINPGYYSGFIARFDSSGTAQWAMPFNSTGNTYSTTVGLDAAGNGYLAGSFSGALDIIGTNMVSAGSRDAFLAKYNSAGTLQWARQVGGPNRDGGRVGVDSAGNSYLIGNFTGSASFGVTNVTSAGTNTLFVARYDTLGNFQWVRLADGNSTIIGSEGGCVTDSTGDCYIPGIFTGTVTFGTNVITSRGGWDVFAAKYDTAGNLKWLQTAGGTNDDGAFRAVVDGAGNCYLAGWFQGTATFGTNKITALGYRDVFLAKLAGPVPVLPTLGLAFANGVPRLSLAGEIGRSYVVEYKASLAGTNWQTLTNLTLAASPQTCTDSTTSGAAQRFYRARLVP